MRHVRRKRAIAARISFEANIFVRLIIMTLFAALVLLYSGQAQAAKKAKKYAGKAVNVTGQVLVRNPTRNKEVRQLKVGDKIYQGEIINTSSGGSAKLLFTDKSIMDLGPSSLFKVDQYQLNKVANRKANFSLGYGKIRASINKKLNAKGRFKIRTKTATMGVRGTEFLVLSDLSTFQTKTEEKQEKVKIKKLKKAMKAGGKKAAKAKRQIASIAKKKAKAAKTQVVVVEGKVAVETPKPKKEEASADVASGSTAKTSKSSAPVMLTAGKALTAVAATAEATGDVVEAPKVEVKEMSVKEMNTMSADVKVDDSTFEQAVMIDDSMGLGSDSAGEDSMGLIVAEMNESFEGGPGGEKQFDFNIAAQDLATPGAFNDRGGIQGAEEFASQVGRPVTIRVEFTP